MSNTKQLKKKISVSISGSNIEKIDNIIKNNPEATTSSIIDTSLSMSLEEVKELIKSPLELEEELLKLRLVDLEKIKKEGGLKK